MESEEILNCLNDFMKKLEDEESKKLFDARFSYFINRSQDEFYEKLDRVLENTPREYRNDMLKKYYERNPQNAGKDIVVFGCGENGKMTIRSLLLMKKSIRCICDNNRELAGGVFRGIPICDVSFVQSAASCHQY